MDNDCDGFAAGCGPAGWVPLSTADAKLSPAPRPADLTTFAAGADTTGDGYDDIAVAGADADGDGVSISVLSGPSRRVRVARGAVVTGGVSGGCVRAG